MPYFFLYALHQSFQKWPGNKNTIAFVKTKQKDSQSLTIDLLDWKTGESPEDPD